MTWVQVCCIGSLGLALCGGSARCEERTWTLAGVSVTPHVRAESMRFRRDPGPANGALVRLFVRGGKGVPARADFRFDGKRASELVASGDWAWSDAIGEEAAATAAIPEGALTVLTFNTRSAAWDRGTAFEVGTRAGDGLRVTIERPRVWLSAVTFLARNGGVYPDRLIAHIENHGAAPVRVEGVRLYTATDRSAWTMLQPYRALDRLRRYPRNGAIAAGDMGCMMVDTGPMPLTQAAVEVVLREEGSEAESVWGHVKIRAESFDISGGWVGGEARDGTNTLTHGAYLKTLKRLHINTGHIGPVPGYTDDAERYGRYPLKHFWALEPMDQFDTEAMLPRVHAAEYMGEPQYGGGRPVAPQDVWRGLVRYAPTRFSSTITLSDEASWRHYAGLSDYPHYDAYRICAPSADSWRLYERWGEERIRWGAPLETIGDMCRSLRELSRPAATAYWSQGVHDGWDPTGGRQRTSPTPDELRLQAYHALASRITSLYWFNLSLGSLVRFPDALDEIARVGREIRMLDDLCLQGTACGYSRVTDGERLDWDLSSIAGPSGAVLFALDLDYRPDPDLKEFVFGPPRECAFRFKLPGYLRSPADVFRVDADGVYDVSWTATDDGVSVRDAQAKVAVYVAAPERGLRRRIEMRRQALVADEQALGFDPARSEADLNALRELLPDERR
jgi:hypothetical protein